MSPDAVTRPRRWFRLRLGVLLLAAALIPAGIGGALRVNTVLDQKAALAAIQQRGGTVWYDYERAADEPDIIEFSPRHEREARTPPGPSWLRASLGDDFYRRVIRVDFVESGISDNDLSQLKDHLGALPRLEAVYLEEEKVTDAGMRHLANLDQLRSISLYGFPLSDDGIAHFADLPKLRRLDLRWTEITDDGLLTLSRMAELERLYIWSDRITDAGLEHLAGLPRLKSLTLQRAPITDAGLAHLARCSALEVLGLSQSKVTSAGVASLKRTLPGIRVSVR